MPANSGRLQETIAHLASEAPVPAIAVSVFSGQEVLAETVQGVADPAGGRRAEADDWWDLASLTKVLVTLPEVLDLAGEPALLQRPLASVWDRAAGHAIGAATIGDVLSHRAGLPATADFYSGLSGADAVIEAALATGVEAGSSALYSDLGFMLLGAMVQDRTGIALSALAEERSGLRMGRAPGLAVATERCPRRNRLIVGEVHDENAWAMGGSAGHAGAFGTLALVARAAQAWLDERVVGRSLHAAAQKCWATGVGNERFGLGWWLTPTRGLGGGTPGPNSYGHSGFVGNRIWLEPDRGYGVVILSNRILWGRGNREPFRQWCDRLLAAVATGREHAGAGEA